jgi:histidyl-tRNA synthetase
VSRPQPLSGFPEYTPEGRIVEQHVIDRLRESFELHGFASIETRAVEPLERLAKQGEIDKEVYAVSRLQAEPGAPPELGLHFDLTVPFARYVLEHAGRLHFPFRRYQIQKVWRGERPQEGRFREFTQADVDIVDVDLLAAHHDVELPLVTLAALERLHVDLQVPPVLMRVSNRLLAQGFYAGLDIADPLPVLRHVDKLDKLGPERVQTMLTEDAGLTDAQAKACLALAGICTPDESFVEQVAALGVHHPELDAGAALLAELVRTANRSVPGRVVADLRIARGLDYYTGTVYETELIGFESWGAIASGGRYDALASDCRTSYPRVGLSIGVTRLLAPLLGQGRLRASRSVPTAVLVAVDSEEQRAHALAVAEQLRARGIPTEVSPRADRYGRQIRYADRRGIPYVWFRPSSGSGTPSTGSGRGWGEVKDIRTGEQVPADAGRWTPPEGDLRPQVGAVPEVRETQERKDG